MENNNNILLSHRIGMVVTICDFCCDYEGFVSHVYFFVCCLSEEFEEKCESTGEAGVSGVSIMSGGQLVPWE